MTPEEGAHRARARMASLLEPEVNGAFDVAHACLTTHQLDRLVQYSQAVSLRRIADALSSSDGLNDVLTSAVGNLANTLSEHRMYSK